MSARSVDGSATVDKALEVLSPDHCDGAPLCGRVFCIEPGLQGTANFEPDPGRAR